MARSTTNKRHRIRGFLILVAIIVIGGFALQHSGDLATPLQSTLMMINLASGDEGFAMVGEGVMPPDGAEVAAVDGSDTTTSAGQDEAVAQMASSDSAPIDAASEETATGTVTLEALTAELAAAGVDVEALAATMTEEGRSLGDLLAVVNSGRTTVADLAARLSGDGTSEATDETAPPPGEDTGLLDIRWDEFGSVVYDLWLFLAVTAVVIVVARPVGWLVNRTKPARHTAST